MAWLDDCRAAIADGGEGALAQGVTAAQVWGIRISAPKFAVWTPRAGVRLPGMVPSVHREVPVVDAGTTILQLAPIRTAADLQACAHMLQISVPSLCQRAEQWVTQRGPSSSAVRQFLETIEQHPEPDSGLETRMLQVLIRAGLREKATLHHRIALGTARTVEVDLAFPAERVVVELDGWAFHRDRSHFANDRNRDVELASLGWVVLRFTHHDIERRPAWAVDRLRRTLSSRRTETT